MSMAPLFTIIFVSKLELVQINGLSVGYLEQDTSTVIFFGDEKHLNYELGATFDSWVFFFIFHGQKENRQRFPSLLNFHGLILIKTSLMYVLVEHA